MKEFIGNVIICILILLGISVVISPIALVILDNCVEPKLVNEIKTENGTVLVFKRFITYEKVRMNKPAEVKSNVSQEVVK